MLFGLKHRQSRSLSINGAGRAVASISLRRNVLSAPKVAGSAHSTIQFKPDKRSSKSGPTDAAGSVLRGQAWNRTGPATRPKRAQSATLLHAQNLGMERFAC